MKPLTPNERGEIKGTCFLSLEQIEQFDSLDDATVRNIGSQNLAARSLIGTLWSTAKRVGDSNFHPDPDERWAALRQRDIIERRWVIATGKFVDTDKPASADFIAECRAADPVWAKWVDETISKKDA